MRITSIAISSLLAISHATLGSAFTPSSFGSTKSNNIYSSHTKSPSRPTTSQQALPFPTDIDTIESLGASIAQIASDVIDGIAASGGNFGAVNGGEISDLATKALATPWHISSIAALAVGGSFATFINGKDTLTDADAPYQPGTDTYDPKAAEEFYVSRPLAVVRRVLKLAFLTGAFNTGILFDWLVLGKLMKDEEYTALKKAEPQRAREALALCEKLGPTFIKLGQALSIRTDLIPEAYALELRKLQDAVPPFPSDEAKEVLRKELGVSNLSEVFSSLSEKPIASASIGQVYRGTLAADGRDVAVKVQRPGILAEIALDLHVLRILTPIQTILQNAANGIKTSQEDIDTAILLVDEWGRGFVAETDYRLEAENTRTFEEAMRKRGLDAVCAPTVVTNLVRDRVLVTEWVDGTRLDVDASPDVPRLCGVAINAYLTMLLDTGVLHCDPHPGNLLRTRDGRLCILDWGMTLAVPNDLQYALLEFIAHINVEDYEAIPQDFINLGFSPEGVTAEKLKDSGVTEGLAFTFRQLSGGGGPKKIQERMKAEFLERYGSDLSDEELRKAARAEMMERMEAQLEAEGVDVKGVTNIMEEMSRRNRELFALPPYVLYVARAFSTLEGIGLSIDENYAIVQECYPYLARRLFADSNPRAKKALRAMLGLSEDELLTGNTYSQSGLAVVKEGAGTSTAAKGGALSADKLIEMSEGFATYTAATSDVDQDGAGQKAAASEFAKILLDPKGSAIQDILVDETARLGDVVVRAGLRSALVESRAAKAAAAALRRPRDSGVSLLPPGPLRDALIERPAMLADILDELTATSEEEGRVLASARELTNAIGTRVFENDNKEGGLVRGQIAGQLSDGASSVPSVPSPPMIPDALKDLLSDEETREAVRKSLPGVATLGRRIGAGLLRRAAYRADVSAVLPQQAKQAFVEGNTALANAIDPVKVTNEENNIDKR
mmetsp:Transcript_18961/g.27784  ORF Transcript_18961/g.27784 Transcript_18961/m.27784 type:complete len:956 (+) Transcript_18961:192-3059(+)